MGLESLKLKKIYIYLNGFHKAPEGLISVLFDYCLIKYYNIILKFLHHLSDMLALHEQIVFEPNVFFIHMWSWEMQEFCSQGTSTTCSISGKFFDWANTRMSNLVTLFSEYRLISSLWHLAKSWPLPASVAPPA